MKFKLRVKMLFNKIAAKDLKIRKVFVAFFALFFTTTIVYGSSNEEKKEQKSSRTISPDPNYADPNYTDHSGAETSGRQLKEHDEIASFKMQYVDIKVPGYFEAAQKLSKSTIKEVKSFGLRALLNLGHDRGNAKAKEAAKIVADSDDLDLANLAKGVLIEIEWEEKHLTGSTS